MTVAAAHARILFGKWYGTEVKIDREELLSRIRWWQRSHVGLRSTLCGAAGGTWHDRGFVSGNRWMSVRIRCSLRTLFPVLRKRAAG